MNNISVDLFIEARWIVPVAPAGVVLEYHTVVVDAGRILAVLPHETADARYTPRQRYKLPQHALIPGLVNLHSHAAMNLMRGLADDLPLMEWLHKHIWPTESANLSPQLNEAAQVLRLDLWQRLRRLVLPGAAPGIFAGLRLSLIYAWLGTIGAEYFMPSNGGIGSQMIGAQQLLRMDLIMAGMLLVGLTGALLNLIGQQIEIRATRWRHA